MAIMRRLKVPVLAALVLAAVALTAGQIARRRYLSQDVGDDSANAVAVMGASETVVISKAFKGGYLRAVMGATELDLTDAVSENKPATIEATVMLGAAGVKVPPEWRVRLNVIQMMGVAADQRRQRDLSGGEIPDLVIVGRVVMGALGISS
jgi:hypothetical protein